MIITGFILFSTVVFAFIGRPVKIDPCWGAQWVDSAICAGADIVRRIQDIKIIGDYKHPLWMSIAGWIVVLAMTWMGINIILNDLPNIVVTQIFVVYSFVIFVNLLTAQSGWFIKNTKEDTRTQRPYCIAPFIKLFFDFIISFAI